MSFDAFLKSTLYLSGTSTNLMLLPIVQIAVLENLPHVIHELICIIVGVVVQFLLNCPHVHWFGDDIEVVHDPELDWVHRIIEPERPLQFPAGIQYL